MKKCINSLRVLLTVYKNTPWAYKGLYIYFYKSQVWKIGKASNVIICYLFNSDKENEIKEIGTNLH